jgi:predicted transcriptional regulator
MPYIEMIKGAPVRTDTTIGVDKETALTIEELCVKHDKTKKAMLRQIVREWMEQQAIAEAHLAKFKTTARN